MTTISSIQGTARDLALRGVAFAPDIAASAARFGLDAQLLAAVAAQETGGPGSNAGRNVVGDGGHGRGLFQIDDRYHAFARSGQAMNPQANADYAAGLLAGLLKQYGGDVHKALSAYNAGDPAATGTVTTWGDGNRLGYADSVMRHYQGLTASSGACTAPPAADTLLDELGAESQTERAGVNLLAGFASAQSPVASHSYRQIAGLDESGRPKQSSDFGSVVDPEDQ